MKIMVSACLLGENCKYSGGNNRNPELLCRLSGHRVIPVCPEVMGGLPTPRSPAEIVNGVVMNREGVFVDEAFRLGAEKALELARREQPDLIILQSRSPSCGMKQIYDGTFSGRLIPGHGVFAGMAVSAGFDAIDVEDALGEGAAGTERLAPACPGRRVDIPVDAPSPKAQSRVALDGITRNASENHCGSGKCAAIKGIAEDRQL